MSSRPGEMTHHPSFTSHPSAPNMTQSPDSRCLVISPYIICTYSQRVWFGALASRLRTGQFNIKLYFPSIPQTPARAFPWASACRQAGSRKNHWSSGHKDTNSTSRPTSGDMDRNPVSQRALEPTAGGRIVKFAGESRKEGGGDAPGESDGPGVPPRMSEYAGRGESGGGAPGGPEVASARPKDGGRCHTCPCRLSSGNQWRRDARVTHWGDLGSTLYDATLESRKPPVHVAVTRRRRVGR